MPDQLHTIARLVRDRRKALRLTQSDLADLARCSVRTIYALEDGKPTLRVDKLLDVLDVLGLELRVEPRRPS